jgi:FkbM family methyltransferase
MKGGELDVLQIEISGSPRSLYLRRSTTDTMLIGQVLVDRAFALGDLPRSPELRNWLYSCQRLGKRPLIVDVGANIGLSSIFFAAEVPQSVIVAVEPEPNNFELLVANTHGLPVLPLPAAIGGEAGRATIENPGRGEWGYRSNFEAKLSKGLVVPAVLLDDILNAFSDNFLPFIVKIDIEGAEKDVFTAHCRWVDCVPLVIVEIHDWMLPRARTSHPVLRRLLQSDRDFVIRGENLFCMLNDLPPPTHMGTL